MESTLRELAAFLLIVLADQLNNANLPSEEPDLKGKYKYTISITEDELALLKATSEMLEVAESYESRKKKADKLKEKVLTRFSK